MSALRTISKLCSLTESSFRSSTAVSLKAREVLILGQMPSYEERLGQMETVLRASLTQAYYGESPVGRQRYFDS